MDSDRLQALVSAPGPFASVFTDDTHDTEDAEKLRELRRRKIRDELAHKGADEQTIRQVDERLERDVPPVGERGRALIANADGVLVDEVLRTRPESPIVRYSPLPYVLPLVGDAPRDRSSVLVEVDRTGADVTAFDALGRAGEAISISGGSGPVHKVRAGGSRGGNRAYHDVPAHVEEEVHLNIERIANEIRRLLELSKASVVFVGGEVQARSALLAELPAEVKDATVELTSGSRAAGNDDSAERERISHLEDRQLELINDTVARFERGRGHEPQLAVAGLGPVTQALRSGQVDTLVITEPTQAAVYLDDSGGTGSGQGAVIEDPSRIALTPEELALGGRRLPTYRADEALPYAAIATDADLVCVGHRVDVADGFGAILRYS